MLVNLMSLIIAVAVTYKAISSFVRGKLKARLTATEDLPLLGVGRRNGEKIRGTVVICGGSISGLLTARVCSDHFEKVVMIEAEEWITTPAGLQDYRDKAPDQLKRSRIHQYTSIHVFQAFFIIALHKLFPNLEREVNRTDAVFKPFLADACWSGHPIIAPYHHFAYGLIPRTIFQTRPVFETTLRRMVTQACPSLEYIPGTVIGLVSEKNCTRIASVNMRSPTGEETSIPATLVIDCTGPADGGLRWLQDLASQTNTQTRKINNGLPLSSLKSTYNPKMAYTTTEFDVPPRLFPILKKLGFPREYDAGGDQYANFPDPALESKNYAIGRRERNFLQISCGGWDVKEQMRSIDDIKRFISDTKTECPPPEWIFRMLDLFKEEEVPVTFSYHRCPPPTYIAYHRAKNLPSNFIAIGDSVLRLNPIRGQGCTKACVEAVTLNALLAKCKPIHNGQVLPEDFGRDFFSAQANRTGYQWDIYRFQDYGWKTTTPAKGDDVNTTGAVMRAYEARFVRVMLKDREVSAVFWYIFNWLSPPTDLFSPSILLKVGWLWFKQCLGFTG